MLVLEIYSDKWFNVSERGYWEGTPCAQLKRFWNFRSLEKAEDKLKELGGNYRVYDHRGKFGINSNLEAREYDD